MSMRPRTVGLSRNQSVPSILSTFNGRKTTDSSSRGTSPSPRVPASLKRSRQYGKDDEDRAQPGSPSQAGSSSFYKLKVNEDQDRKKTLKKTTTSAALGDDSSQESVPTFTAASSRRSKQISRPVAPEEDNLTGIDKQREAKAAAIFNPPPAASETEDDSDTAGNVISAKDNNSRSRLLDDSDSEQDSLRRGDLRPTKFSTQASKTTGASGNGSQKTRISRSSDTKRDVPLRSSQVASLSQPTSSAGSHFENALGHVRKHKAKTTYRKARSQQSSKQTKKQKKGFEQHSLEDSPVKSRATFQLPDDSDGASPSKRTRAQFQSGSEDDSDNDSVAGTASIVKRKSKGGAGMRAVDKEEKKEKPTFFIPEGSPDTALDRTPPTEMLRRSSSSMLSDMDQSDDDNRTAASLVASTASAVCPWCGKPVKAEALKSLSKGRMNVRMQTRFCRMHQKQTARDDWQLKGYPDIDWDVLPDRLARHHDLLLSIVNGERDSPFRDALAEDIRKGKSRTLRQEENLNPGYYGPRGFNLMCDFLVTNFGDLLKDRAVNDVVIAGRGSAAFIQAVLVAELAVELIKEDMSVGLAEARTVFHESKELGEFVHEDR